MSNKEGSHAKAEDFMNCIVKFYGAEPQPPINPCLLPISQGSLECDLQADISIHDKFPQIISCYQSQQEPNIEPTASSRLASFLGKIKIYFMLQNLV